MFLIKISTNKKLLQSFPGPTVRLTSDVIRKLLGLTIMDPNNEYRLSSWLAQQEDKHKVN